ncbi:hypothetical protein PCK1_000862 [Pneumocystis canis]|nr:hypothetical protein PCK1_000862 [Pneumocystis canis]
MLERNIHYSDFSTSFIHWEKVNCMTSDQRFSKDLSLSNELRMVPEQDDYLIPLYCDSIVDRTAYLNHNTDKFNTMSLKDKSDGLPNNFRQTKTFSDFISGEDTNTSFYGMIPGLPVDSFTSAYSLSSDAPVRLSSPIHLNLSSSLPNPTIEQLHPGKKSFNSQDNLNITFSPSSSNGGYESASPPTVFQPYYDTSNTLSSLTTKTLSSDSVPLAADSSKKKSPSRSSVSGLGIKRPLNSFMLYRRDKQSSIPTNNHQSISRIIGEMWKRETIEEKERYAEMALRERERHAKEYPDYKFLPRKKKDKNANGKSPRRKKTYDPVLEQDESKILRMMLNQISHKSQSDTVKCKTNQNNYHWLLGDNSSTNMPPKKTFFDTTDQASHVTDFSGNLQLMPSMYEYQNQNVMPLSIMSTKSGSNNINVYGSSGMPNTFNNYSDHDIHTLINAYNTGSLNETSLSDIFNRSSTDSSQNVSVYHGVKNIESIEKNETQNISLLSAFDSTVLQDDMGYLQDSFSGSWDETMEFSSFSTPNPLDNQEIMIRSSLDPMNPALVNTS